jgi:DnaJ-class molecular chaperone
VGLGVEKIFDPENVGMVVCPLCNGNGKLPEDHDGFDACTRCGGFGLIIKEREISGKKTIEFRSACILLP